ncbi:IS1096 element passenger TnpR family protein [Altibacter sp. HG106]|uniref:IS1096 element passenger TnpR family protein n=1 Tax=Altibacter sp. HG106 TaxID=3023937 RepID=UPI002351003B|nr:hypothetical protein [Altibacter sp. HG106]MDC7993965.1 hypothetical protein [Altibacter sp. HG106]
MVYRIRIILDASEDVFRDVEIETTQTLEDLHNVILQSFGFDGQEMASFYVSNEEWEQGEEIALFDMSETPGSVRVMNETAVDDVLSEKQTKLIYVYDFLSMWTFLVELAEVTEPEDGMSYPNLMYAHGQIPAEAPETEFVGEDLDPTHPEDDMDMDLDPDDYDNLDFDENWN